MTIFPVHFVAWTVAWSGPTVSFCFIFRHSARGTKRYSMVERYMFSGSIVPS